mgnify:FL=1|jgi:hypothetical protein
MENTKECRKCNKVQKIECFSKHSGTKDKLDNRCKTCVKNVKQTSKENNTEVKVYPIYNLDLDYKDWQVGKPTGSILERTDSTSNAKRYEVRIPLGNGKMRSKSFAFNNFISTEEAKQAANDWLIKYSKENNLTKNMIRILDKDTIEIKLTQNMIMKTDMVFANICQEHILCSSKSGAENSDYYSIITINNSNILFHKHITGNNMTDHINRDPLDNRLVNLRKTTSKLNNNNRTSPKKCLEYNFHILGIRFVDKDESWQARIKQDGKEYTRSFAVKKYGYEIAKEMAIAARQEFNIKFGCSNSNISTDGGII